jgi:ATP-dependent Lon protease
MELVTIDGYTEDDKVAIARDYLPPRQRRRAALTTDEVTVTDAALREIAANYTGEPGVRQFERLLAKALRKVTTKLADDPTPLTIDVPDLVGYLGRPRFTRESAERTAVPGVATGLAVTGLGGDVFFIEASANGTVRLAATDLLLSVEGTMRAEVKKPGSVALHARQLGSTPRRWTVVSTCTCPRARCPRTAVGRRHDGHRAGVDGHRRQVRSDVGMTGEVTLNGRVLPIGGVKQKLLAAQRAGLTTVFIPQRNEPDLDDVPAEVLDAEVNR